MSAKPERASEFPARRLPDQAPGVDKEQGRQGDKEKDSSAAVSPCLPPSLSPCLPPRRGSDTPLAFHPGDLLVFTGQGFTSRVIEWATRGPSHVGILCPHADFGPLLYESTTLCDEPCVLTGKSIRGVQAHLPASRVARYSGTVSLLRLMPAWKLNREEVALLHRWLSHVVNEAYDLRGAILSGTRLFKWTALMPYPDLGSLFCSELCAAALMRLHRMPLSNPSAYNPASLMRELRRCGTYAAPISLQVPPLPRESQRLVNSPLPGREGPGVRETATD